MAAARRTLPPILAPLLLLLALVPAARASYAPGASDQTPAGIPDEDVPYGVASGFIVGHKLLQEGKTSEALPYLHMAYRAQPEVMDIALDFQQALAAEGYVKEALEVVDKLITAHPDSLGFLVQRANLNLKSGQSDAALADLRTLRAAGHVSFAILDAEASILAATDRPDQALDVYRDGLAALPADGPDIYLGMTGVLQKAGRDDEIPALLDEAVAAYPDAPRLWLVKARVLAVTGDDEAALATAVAADTHFAARALAEGQTAPDSGEEFGPVPGADPAPDSFVVELADFYAQRGRPDQALAILAPLAERGELGLSPSLWLGRLLLGTGRNDEGAAVVGDILARWPDAPRAWFLKGKVAEGAGDWAGSLPAYRHAVELAPRDPEIRLGYVRAMLVAWEADLVRAEPDDDATARRDTFARHLAVADTIVPDEDRAGQLILGYGHKARREFDRAAWRFGLAAESPELRRGALLQKSLCHDEAGEEGKARQDLEVLRREYPGDPEVANSLGYFLAEKGQDLELAAALVGEALAAEPGNGAYLDSMGWIHYRNGDLEQALDLLIQAVNVLPEDPVVLEHLGMVLKAQGRPREALDVLQRARAAGGDRERIDALIAEVAPLADEAAGAAGR